MKITKVSLEEVRTLILLPGWDSVEKALTAFSDGTPAGRKAESKEMSAIGKDHGGKAVGLALLASAVIGKQKDTIAGRFLTEAKKELAKGSYFERSYDYDGMGTPFFKASVTLTKLTSDLYGLGIFAAYVGDEPEAGLAGHLGLPRGLSECTVDVETEFPPKDHFEFDFEPMLRKLDPVLGTTGVTGAEVAKKMVEPHLLEHRGFVLKKQKGLVVRIEPHTVGYKDTWKVHGSVLSGELAHEYEPPHAKLPPTLRLTIATVDKNDEKRLMWRSTEQARVLDAAKNIAAALQ